MKDLRIFSKQHLEQYYLSLNHCHIETEEEKTNHVNVTVDEANVVHSFDHWKAKSADPEIFAALSIPVQCWRPYAFESEREYFTKGRFSNEEISLVPMVKNSISTDVIEKCGVNHRFYGRVALTFKYTSNDFPSFIIENLKISEGKWYYIAFDYLKVALLKLVGHRMAMHLVILMALVMIDIHGLTMVLEARFSMKKLLPMHSTIFVGKETIRAILNTG